MYERHNVNPHIKFVDCNFFWIRAPYSIMSASRTPTRCLLGMKMKTFLWRRVISFPYCRVIILAKLASLYATGRPKRWSVCTTGSPINQFSTMHGSLPKSRKSFLASANKKSVSVSSSSIESHVLSLEKLVPYPISV
jgi:hypothetical protein